MTAKQGLQKEYWTPFYDAAFQSLKKEHGNVKAGSYAKAIANKCMTIALQVWEDGGEHIASDMICETGDTHAHGFDKQQIIDRIAHRIATGGLTKDQELKYIAELNKLQDNYNDQVDEEYVVELIQYLCPVCDGAREAETRKPTSRFH